MNTFVKENEKKITAAVCVILSAVFLSLIWNNNVWMDEAFTASLVHTDLAGVLERSMNDTLPPLYNIVLWLMTQIFGYRLPVMKITSVIPMILTIVLGAVTVRRRFGFKKSLLFMLFVTFMPLMLYFGVEIRMYSLGFFFATGSWIYAYETVVEPSSKNRILFILFSVLAGYSHHFAFVTAGFAYLYMLIFFIFFKRERLAEWFMHLLATFVLYLPCMIVTISQFSRVSGYFSMPDIDLKMFVQYALYPYITGNTFGTLVCMALIAVSFVAFFFSVKKKNLSDEKVFAVCCFSVYYMVLLFGTAVCAVMSANIFVDRYLFFSSGILWLFAAIMLGDGDRTFCFGLAAAVIVGVFTYTGMFRTEYKNSAAEEMAFLRDNIKEGDLFFEIGGHEEMQNCIPFYTMLDKETPELTFVYPLEEAVRKSEEGGHTLWISVLDGFEPSEDDRKILDENGLVLEKEADFEFDRYKCGFYKVTHQGFVKK